MKKEYKKTPKHGDTYVTFFKTQVNNFFSYFYKGPIHCREDLRSAVFVRVHCVIDAYGSGMCDVVCKVWSTARR